MNVLLQIDTRTERIPVSPSLRTEVLARLAIAHVDADIRRQVDALLQRNVTLEGESFAEGNVRLFRELPQNAAPSTPAGWGGGTISAAGGRGFGS